MPVSFHPSCLGIGGKSSEVSADKILIILTQGMNVHNTDYY
jgi:hypothetical protein